MKTIHVMQCMYMHEMPTVMNEMSTNSNCYNINARVMITTNIDVTDELTNGAMGTVTNVVTDEKTGKMSVILVSFDSKHVGQ